MKSPMDLTWFSLLFVFQSVCLQTNVNGQSCSRTTVGIRGGSACGVYGGSTSSQTAQHICGPSAHVSQLQAGVFSYGFSNYIGFILTCSDGQTVAVPSGASLSSSKTFAGPVTAMDVYATSTIVRGIVIGSSGVGSTSSGTRYSTADSFGKS